MQFLTYGMFRQVGSGMNFFTFVPVNFKPGTENTVLASAGPFSSQTIPSRCFLLPGKYTWLRGVDTRVSRGLGR